MYQFWWHVRSSLEVSIFSLVKKVYRLESMRGQKVCLGLFDLYLMSFRIRHAIKAFADICDWVATSCLSTRRAQISPPIFSNFWYFWYSFHLCFPGNFSTKIFANCILKAKLCCEICLSESLIRAIVGHFWHFLSFDWRKGQNFKCANHNKAQNWSSSDNNYKTCKTCQAS